MARFSRVFLSVFLSLFLFSTSLFLIQFNPKNIIRAQALGCYNNTNCTPSYSGQTCYCTVQSSCTGGYCLGSNSGTGTCACSTTNSCTGTWSACIGCSQYKICTENGSTSQTRFCDSGNCGSGGGGGGGDPAASACVIELTPTSSSLVIGNNPTVNLNADVTTNTAMQGVTFSSNNNSVASVSPVGDTTVAYSSTATAVGVGTATITASGIDSFGVALCTDTSVIAVSLPGAWWQVKDSDITSSGDLSSDIPNGSYFNLPGDGGYPGVPAFGSSTSITGSNVSTNGWLTESPPTNEKVYNNAFFNNQIPKDTVITTITDNNIDGSIFTSGGTPSYGYYWYKYDGSITDLDLTINAPVNLGSRKVILLVNSADLYINGSINLTDGQGFFMTSVGKTSSLTKGNIYVSATVGNTSYDLEGIYEADGIFATGTSALPLSVRGAVTGYDGVVMTRDLGAGSNSNPAEFYEYAPDQMMLYPSRLGSRKISWKEVAP